MTGRGNHSTSYRPFESELLDHRSASVFALDYGRRPENTTLACRPSQWRTLWSRSAWRAPKTIVSASVTMWGAYPVAPAAVWLQASVAVLIWHSPRAKPQVLRYWRRVKVLVRSTDIFVYLFNNLRNNIPYFVQHTIRYIYRYNDYKL